MIPTVFGIFTAALGLWLLRLGNPLLLVCGMVGLILLGASAALVLPALGGSSIPPARLMLLFLAVGTFMQLRTRASLAREAFIANGALILFCAYGLISALILPRIFAGQVDVVPMRAVGLRHILDTFPLAPSSQNTTTAFYLLGTGLTAFCTYVAARLASDVMPLIKTWVAVTWTHIITGVLGAVLAGTWWDTLVDFVRSGSYAQTRQDGDDFSRIYGLFPEPSYYATVGYGLMIFLIELWLRNVAPRRTGLAALGMAAVLTLSTSSTAYVAMGGYAAILATRTLFFPSYLSAGKVAGMALGLLAAITALLGLLVFSPEAAATFGEMFSEMTVEKSQSMSGQQRTFWAMQGLHLFGFSWGIGVGAGSFRSSSLITAIIGSMGVVGAVTFLIYCARLMLWRAQDRVTGTDDTRLSVAKAAGWAALAGLIPDAVMGNGPDPGLDFATLAGLSLALYRPVWKDSAAKLSLWGGHNPVSPARWSPVPQSAGWRRSSR